MMIVRVQTGNDTEQIITIMIPLRHRFIALNRITIIIWILNQNLNLDHSILYHIIQNPIVLIIIFPSSENSESTPVRDEPVLAMHIRRKTEHGRAPSDRTCWYKYGLVSWGGLVLFVRRLIYNIRIDRAYGWDQRGGLQIPASPGMLPSVEMKQTSMSWKTT